jgi:hypothetical protein
MCVEGKARQGLFWRCWEGKWVRFKVRARVRVGVMVRAGVRG